MRPSNETSWQQELRLVVVLMADLIDLVYVSTGMDEETAFGFLMDAMYLRPFDGAGTSVRVPQCDKL